MLITVKGLGGGGGGKCAQSWWLINVELPNWNWKNELENRFQSRRDRVKGKFLLFNQFLFRLPDLATHVLVLVI